MAQHSVHFLAEHCTLYMGSQWASFSALHLLLRKCTSYLLSMDEVEVEVEKVLELEFCGIDIIIFVRWKSGAVQCLFDQATVVLVRCNKQLDNTVKETIRIKSRYKIVQLCFKLW